MRYISPWIFTTNQCNLRCPYCYVKWNDDKMSKKTYKKINDTFLGMLSRNELDFCVYRIAGGEPALVFDDWKPFVEEFLTNCGGKGFVSIITNLTILTDDMLQFFKEHKDKIGFGVSLDGYSYSKPFPDGRSTAGIVRENIDKLISIGIKNIDISTVLDSKSFSDLDALAEYVSKRNIGWGIYLDHFFCGEIEYEKICLNVIKAINVLNANNYDLIHNFKFDNIKLDSHYEGCTAGEKLITIATNGDLYPCQTLINEKPIKNIFDVCDLIEELKNQKYYKVGYNYELPEDCMKCSLKDLCGGGCKLHNLKENRKFTCDIIKTVLLYLTNTVLEG